LGAKINYQGCGDHLFLIYYSSIITTAFSITLPISFSLSMTILSAILNGCGTFSETKEIGRRKKKEN
jgi:hypothetical protein